MRSIRLGAWSLRAKAYGQQVQPRNSLMRNSLRAGLIVSALVIVSAALAQDRAKVAAGAEVYATHCAACHGERLRATGAGFDLLKLQPNERERFDKAVNDGKGQMPPWGGVLSPGEIDQLWSYIRSRADS